MSVLDSYRVLGDVTVVTAPTVEPVQLATAKAHLRVDLGTEDVLIESLIRAARLHVEALTGLACITQTLDYTFDDFPENGSPLFLPRTPVASITSVTSYSTAHVASTFASASYTLLSTTVPAKILLNDGYDWPSSLRDEAGGVVRFVAGYGTAESAVPEPIRQAMLLLIAHWFVQREPTAAVTLTPIPLAIDALLAPYRLRLGVGL